MGSSKGGVVAGPVKAAVLGAWLAAAAVIRFGQQTLRARQMSRGRGAWAGPRPPWEFLAAPALVTTRHALQRAARVGRAGCCCCWRRLPATTAAAVAEARWWQNSGSDCHSDSRLKY